MIENELEELLDDDFLFYSHLYSSITVVFAMAVLSKFFTNQARFGFRSFLTLVVVFMGEPLCHFLLRGPSGVIIFGVACLAVYSILPASRISAVGKHILVTGCDSGFGNALARELDSMGAVVYAGCLCTTSVGAEELQKVCSNRLKLLPLDVTSDKQVTAARDYVEDEIDSQGLWAIMNNAGLWYLSEIEMTSEKIFRQVLDINLFGMIRVTKALLPLLRQSKGRVVNMSSVAGRIAFENYGAYCVAKSAIEMYSDVLRLEMKKWDVKVSVIEPVGFKTAAVSTETIAQRKADVWSSLDEATRAVYGEKYLDTMYNRLNASVPKYPTDISPVVSAMTNALLSQQPQTHYTVGRGAKTLITLYNLLPTSLADRLASALSVTAAGRESRPTQCYK